MKSKYKIIALFGPSASGKDTIKKKLLNTKKELNSIIAHTTRPKRENEKDGVDYHYINEEEFAKMLLSGNLIEATSFRDWFYGTSISQLKENNINIGVFNLNAIQCLLQESRISILPIFVAAPDKDRLIRSLGREEEVDCDEICRRFLSDKKDFSNIDFNYLTIVNSNSNKDNGEFYNYILENFDKLYESLRVDNLE